MDLRPTGVCSRARRLPDSARATALSATFVTKTDQCERLFPVMFAIAFEKASFSASPKVATA